jgi:hypothetical protein
MNFFPWKNDLRLEVGNNEKQNARAFAHDARSGPVGRLGCRGKRQSAELRQKDMCLLAAMNCANETDTFQQRIERLQHEIQKGTDVYTPDELNILNRQLLDKKRELHDLEHKPLH